MPVKRRRSKERKFQIDEAVVLFARARELAPFEQWEEDGGRRREYLETWKALHLALGLKLFEASPLDVREGDSVRYGGQCWMESVPKALAVRAELIAVAGTE
ncbi:hypothetical protein BSZ19_16210 [Bradyrhizobium japonicum]|uniref:Uncharacterized protein n=1 Tax=Bradyrhizobium japonicum TaxID=375 RepID=A0A1Y2JQ11_BRAJP|nr:hypothetical protein [Bradyrhizobium japonicum]OSJ33187.1 hypothetical protein BSZ19_16210 [Bradyrhizobium japonicum]